MIVKVAKFHIKNYLNDGQKLDSLHVLQKVGLNINHHSPGTSQGSLMGDPSLSYAGNMSEPWYEKGPCEIMEI